MKITHYGLFNFKETIHIKFLSFISLRKVCGWFLLGSEGSRGRWLWTNFIKMCRDSPGPPPEPGPENNIPLWCSETIRGQIRDSGAEHSQARSLPAQLRGEYPVSRYVCNVLVKLAKCFLIGSL